MNHAKDARFVLTASAVLLAIVEVHQYLTPGTRHNDWISPIIVLVSLAALHRVRSGAAAARGRGASAVLTGGLAVVMLVSLGVFFLSSLVRQTGDHRLTQADVGYLLTYLFLVGVLTTAAIVAFIGAVVLTRNAELLPVAGIWTLMVGIALDFYGDMFGIETWGMLVCGAGLLVVAATAPRYEVAPEASVAGESPIDV